MIKLHGKIIIKKYLFFSKSINFDLPLIFNNWFSFSAGSYRCETFCSFKGFLKINNESTKKLGREALINNAISSWNEIIKYISSNKMLGDVPTFKLKPLLKKHFLETYNTS